MWEKLPEFISHHPLLSLAFVATLLALIYTEIARRMRGFSEISPQQLTRLINREDAHLVDVSPLADYDAGHIVGAEHILASQVDPQGDAKLAKWKQSAVAVYCKNGQTSEQVAGKFSKAGFSNVSWLKGGLLAWQDAQLPTTSGKKKKK